MSEVIKYSFSRLDSFHNCKRGYYYTYGLKERGGENIYSFLGTVCHELCQGIIEGKETNESTLIKFKEALDDTELLGLEWISDKVKNNYSECIIHFLENFSPTKADDIKIEEYFEVEIEGSIVRGYIDLCYILNGELYIIDLKTSSKFSKKDMLKKRRQLSLYAFALQNKYPSLKIKLYFDMLKYAIQGKKLVERNNLSIFHDFEEGMVEIVYDDELIADLKEYVKDTVDEINMLDITDIDQWEMGYKPNYDFFCRKLCSNQARCLDCTNNI